MPAKTTSRPSTHGLPTRAVMFAVVAAGLLALAGCKDGAGDAKAAEDDKQEANAVPVEVAQASRRSVAASYSGTAPLEARAESMVVAKTSVVPTLVFDEVDAGIGGATGDVVGCMLRQLGESAQVLCVTHLAQVASKAHHHLRVEKTISKKAAATSIAVLQGEAKVQEIARMMGGAVDSQQSLAHAREMLGT